MALPIAWAKILWGLWRPLGYNLRGCKIGFQIHSAGIRGWRPWQYDFIKQQNIQEETSPLLVLKVILTEWSSRDKVNA